DADIEEAEAEIVMLDEQQEAAALRADDLSGEAATEQALSDAIRNAALDLETCVTNRFEVVKGLWEHGRTYVATLDAQTNRDCAAAQATLDRLIEEMD
ncbi:MAG: hypothetical protein MUP36_03605, partial [Demequinaceae bacterium]|nr:hypothetical protein [Demequinaceae bacterium]